MKTNWHLLKQMTRRDLASRYRGSLFGLLWMLLTPLLMLAVYSFVFGVVFEAKWGVDVNGQAVPFPLLFFSGLILHGVLAEVLPRSVMLIRSHPNYVKKVVFPVELLPVMITISAFSLWLVQFGLLTIVCAYFEIYPTLNWLWLPFLMLPFILMVLGLAWLVSALGVFLPDLQHVMGLMVTLLLFMCPIFYPIEMLPAQWQSFLYLNPLTPMVEAMRGLLFFDQLPDMQQWLSLWITALALWCLGRWLFRRAKPVFADVL